MLGVVVDSLALIHALSASRSVKRPGGYAYDCCVCYIIVASFVVVTLLSLLLMLLLLVLPWAMLLLLFVSCMFVRLVAMVVFA